MSNRTLVMPTIARRVLGGLMVGSLLMTNLLTSAFAANSVGATPLKVVLDIDPGATKNFEIQAINRNEEKMTYKVEVKQASSSDEQGNASFTDAKADEKEAVPNWVTIKDKEVNVEPNSMAPVKFEIKVPTGVAPGGHYGMILLTPKDQNPAGGNVGIVGQVGVPILVKVNGAIIENGKVEGFSLDQQKLKEGDPVIFQLKFANEGNVHMLPEGRVYLKTNGQPLTKVAKIKNTDGSEEIVDYLPINPGKGYVLPNSKRAYEIQWELNKQYTNVTASYELTYGKEKVQKASGEQTVSIEKNIAIESFAFDAAKEQFSVKMKNTGNVQMPLRGQINIYSEAGGDSKVTITAPSEGQPEYIAQGETKELTVAWTGLKALNPTETSKYNAIFSYVVDQTSGKSLTSKVNLAGNGDSSFMSMFNGNNALPIAILVVLVIGIIAVIFTRKK